MSGAETEIINTIVRLLEGEGFSQRAIEYYLKQVNVGKLKNPTASFVFTGACGDTVEIYLKIEKGVIKDAKFITTGCSASFISGSAFTKLLKGKTLEEAEQIEGEDILAHLGGSFPEQKIHCVRLVKKTLEEALKQYKEK
jgi:NifU-like protein involved in Fe-S cluster formation